MLKLLRDNIHFIVLIYFVVISLISAVVTVSDKRKAQNGKWRIQESTLIFLSLLGGGISMYITMKICRHKTKKKKFMIGIPLIIFLHIGLLVVLHSEHLLNCL